MRFLPLVAYFFILCLISACTKLNLNNTDLGQLTLKYSPSNAEVELQRPNSVPSQINEPTLLDKKEENEYRVNTYDLEPGPYTIILSAEGYETMTLEQIIKVAETTTLKLSLEPLPQPNTEPLAAFSATPETGTVPLEVKLDASASSDSDGELTEFTWDMGDGALGTGETLTHTYTEPGDYRLTLTVLDDEGAKRSLTKTISVSAPLKAEFTATPLSGDAPLEVTLDASASNGSAFTWDFGDGEEEQGVTAKHVYTEAGDYTVHLTVTSEEGQAVTSSQHIAVNAPPIASFTSSSKSSTLPLEVYFSAVSSSDSDGEIVDYLWDFGDGTVGEGVETSHSYLASGAFEVTLTVTDDNGSSVSTDDFVYVDVIPPQAQFTYSPATGTAPYEVTFDASTSQAGGNEIVSYLWNFGDGTSGEGRVAKHIFTEPGDFTVELTVRDSAGVPARAKSVIAVNGAPSARFDQTTNAGKAPLTVRFDASQSSDPENGSLNYTWSFGDGTTAKGSDPEHTFTRVGDFEVKLIVTDTMGATSSRTSQVSVKNAPPVAAFTLSSSSGFAPHEINADASGSSDPNDTLKAYVWDFGDGTKKSGQRVSHNYTEVGNYNLFLTVTDSYGASTTVAKQIIVENRPPTAAFSAPYREGSAPFKVQFDASASFDDGTVERYDWTFGDGTVATGKIVSHSFETQGTYTVRLTVTDNDGGTHSVTETVIVTPPFSLEPLSVSPDKHSILSGGEPFFWLGDTAWALWTTTTHEDVLYYLDDAKAKGFNVIQVFMTTIWGGNGSNGENFFGERPFIDNDPTKLNPAYFDYVDWVIDQAARRGLYVAVTYGEPGRVDDSRISYRITDEAEGYDYSYMLGERFRQKTLENKIIWLVGQDRRGTEDLGPSSWRAMAEGLSDGINGQRGFDSVSNYTTSFMSFHPGGYQSSSRWFSNDIWLDIDSVNTYKQYSLIQDRVHSDYTAALRPTACLENSYEGHNLDGELRTDWHGRFQGYWCVMTGSIAYGYGHYPGYRMLKNSNWKDYLQSPGRLDMVHLKSVLTSRSIVDRVPDQSLITSNPGSADYAKTFIAAARADDGSYAFVYSTQGLSFDLDLTKLSGSQVKAQWFDPREGTYTNLGTFAKSTSVSFNPPGEPGEGNDWLLVLDAVN